MGRVESVGGRLLVGSPPEVAATVRADLQLKPAGGTSIDDLT
jgi:hypothetical protein